MLTYTFALGSGDATHASGCDVAPTGLEHFVSHMGDRLHWAGIGCGSI